MRHHSNKRKFGREKNARNALMRSLVRSLILEERIKTTTPKAKSLRPVVEALVTKAKVDSLITRRLLISRIGCKDSTTKLIKELAPRFNKRPGGYTRIIKTTPRIKDGSSMSIIEFVK